MPGRALSPGGRPRTPCAGPGPVLSLPCPLPRQPHTHSCSLLSTILGGASRLGKLCEGSCSPPPCHPPRRPPPPALPRAHTLRRPRVSIPTSPTEEAWACFQNGGGGTAAGAGGEHREGSTTGPWASTEFSGSKWRKGLNCPMRGSPSRVLVLGARRLGQGQASEAGTGSIFQNCGHPAGHNCLAFVRESLKTAVEAGAGAALGWECQLLPGGPRRASWKRWPLVGLSEELDRVVFHLLFWSYVV